MTLGGLCSWEKMQEPILALTRCELSGWTAGPAPTMGSAGATVVAGWQLSGSPKGSPCEARLPATKMPVSPVHPAKCVLSGRTWLSNHSGACCCMHLDKDHDRCAD